MVELRHVGHDEELVWTLASHNVVNIQQLRNTELWLRNTEREQTVAETKAFIITSFSVRAMRAFKPRLDHILISQDLNVA